MRAGREKEQMCRRGREDDECANRRPGTSAAAAERLLDPDTPRPQLPILCPAPLIEISLKCPEAFAKHQLTLSLELGYS